MRKSLKLQIQAQKDLNNEENDSIRHKNQSQNKNYQCSLKKNKTQKQKWKLKERITFANSIQPDKKEITALQKKYIKIKQIPRYVCLKKKLLTTSIRKNKTSLQIAKSKNKLITMNKH